VILLISASQVARITGMSQWCPAKSKVFKMILKARKSTYFIKNVLKDQYIVRCQKMYFERIKPPSCK
jgi:hypothetical protein